MSRFSGPELLTKANDVSRFDCGDDQLNSFLQKFALQNQANNSARTFVGLDGDRVIGFYSLAVGAVAHEIAPDRVKKGLARHPIPVVLMARLGVDVEYQRQGVGIGLFKDALKRCLSVSQDAGVRAFLVHAKDEDARKYYLRFGLESNPDNPLHLYLLLKDLEKSLTESD